MDIILERTVIKLRFSNKKVIKWNKFSHWLLMMVSILYLTSTYKRNEDYKVYWKQRPNFFPTWI